VRPHGAGLRIALAWGKAPKPESVPKGIAARLRALGVHVREHLPHDDADAWPTWTLSFDLVVHRGVRSERLEAALRDPATSVLPWCNPLGPTLEVADRWTLQTRLERAGVSTPPAERRETWSEVLARHAPPCVVKRVDGRAGRAAGVLLRRAGPLPAAPPFDGPYLVQALVPGDGIDRTLYVAGTRVFLALKRVDAESGRSELLGVTTPNVRARDLALRTGTVLGLEVYGLDAIETPVGLVVVDVNPFPGFRGIPGAAEAISLHLVRRARSVAPKRQRTSPRSTPATEPAAPADREAGL